ncbi:hypothetical protein GIB67_002376 [Kingdonia uniflora]|uniref:Uncharacterized protein n=1 Tax=Kingdonia uniflora TaxID=39325 RepID=A0A7J7M8L1_9MAGN|nr:hypothetical protein GIB67_002376 [Kingdonia uniflora]
MTEGMLKLTLYMTLDLEARHLHDEGRITHLTAELRRAEGRLSQLNDYLDGKSIGKVTKVKWDLLKRGLHGGGVHKGGVHGDGHLKAVLDALIKSSSEEEEEKDIDESSTDYSDDDVIDAIKMELLSNQAEIDELQETESLGSHFSTFNITGTFRLHIRDKYWRVVVRANGLFDTAVTLLESSRNMSDFIFAKLIKAYGDKEDVRGAISWLNHPKRGLNPDFEYTRDMTPFSILEEAHAYCLSDQIRWSPMPSISGIPSETSAMAVRYANPAPSSVPSQTSHSCSLRLRSCQVYGP